MMKREYIRVFENKFGLSFLDVTGITDFVSDSNDDGIYHFINLSTYDVYSFDSDEEVWLDKNLHQAEIIQLCSLTRTTE